MTCAVCNVPVTWRDSRPYLLGAIKGRLCLRCHGRLSEHVGRFLNERLSELADEQEATHPGLAKREPENHPRGLRAVGGG